MRKRFALLLLLPAVMVLPLTACGGSAPSEMTAGGTAASEIASKETEAGVTAEGTTETKETTEENREGIPKMPLPDAIVYVSDGGEGNGSSADSPLGSLADAVEQLKDTGGTVVLCGDVTLDGEKAIPAADGNLLITGQGGKLSLLSSLEFSNGNQGHTIALEDLTIVNSSASGPSKIFCDYNNMVFGDRLTVEGGKYFPVIYEGYYSRGETWQKTQESVSHEGDVSVYIGSGTWESYIGGNYRDGEMSPMGVHRGSMNLQITGGTFLDTQAVSDENYVPGTRNQSCCSTSFVGMNFFDGDVDVKISGGSFEGPVFAVGRYGNLNGVMKAKYPSHVSRGDISIEIAGGSFSGGEITALQPCTESPRLLRGDYSLSVSEGVSLPDGVILSAECIEPYAGETAMASLTVPESVHAVIRGFDQVNGTGQDGSEPVRIAFIGDSITYGHGSSQLNVKSYPAQLQFRLEQEGKAVIVGNFGVGSSSVLDQARHRVYQNTLLGAISMEEFDPDIVVFALGTNDAGYAAAQFSGALMDGFMDRFYSDYKNLILSYGKLPSVENVYVTTALHREDNAEKENVVVSKVIPYQKQIVEELSAENADATYTLIDLYSLTLEDARKGGFFVDGLHLSDTGYQIVANHIYDALFAGNREE